jgi:hypothetical protein
VHSGGIEVVPPLPLEPRDPDAAGPPVPDAHPTDAAVVEEVRDA